MYYIIVMVMEMMALLCFLFCFVFFILWLLAATASSSQNVHFAIYFGIIFLLLFSDFVCNLNILKMLKVLPCLVESRRLLVEDLMVFVVAVIDFVPFVE